MTSLIADKVLPENLALKLMDEALNTTGQQIAIDTETNGKDIRDGRGKVYGFSVAYRTSDGVVSFYCPIYHKNPGGVGNYRDVDFLPRLQRLVHERTPIFHNAKSDLGALSTCNISVDGQFLDTLKLAHLLDENLYDYGLDAVAKKFIGRPGKQKSDEFNKLMKVFGWEDMPPEGHGEYAAYDTYSTFEVFEAQKPLLAAENLAEMWKHKQEFLRLLIDIERNGVLVDQDLCDRMAEEGEIRQYEIRTEWKQRFGRELNPMSPKDLKFLIRDTLRLPEIYHPKTGNPTFDKNAMEQYEQILALTDDPLAREIIEYRGWNKSVSSNYQSYLHLLSPDGRLRPNFKWHGTKTGRLSCEKPNLQQIPRKGSKLWNGQMKKCFIPEDGYELIECDYSQLEFRLQAGFAQETRLLEAFSDPDRDVFTEIAESLGWTRQEGKGFVYSTGYGAGPPRISIVFRVNEATAKQHIENFYSLYPNLRQASRMAASEVLRRGKILLPYGRYRHFLFPQSDAHKAFNSFIQGTAADIVERAMVKLAKAGFNDGVRSRMLLQVHDSVLFEIRKDFVEEAKPEIARIMADVTPDFGVIFKADPKKWGE